MGSEVVLLPFPYGSHVSFPTVVVTGLLPDFKDDREALELFKFRFVAFYGGLVLDQKTGVGYGLGHCELRGWTFEVPESQLAIEWRAEELCQKIYNRFHTKTSRNVTASIPLDELDLVRNPERLLLHVL